MIKNLRKKIFGETENTMEKGENKQVDLSAITASFEEKLNAVTAQFDVKVQELTAALATVEQLKAALASAEDAKAVAEAAVKAQKLATRKSLLSVEIGDEKAQAILVATESLDDTAFEAVASAMVGAAKAEAKTALFKEVGIDGKVDDVAKVTEETPEMKALKKKYAGTPAK